MSNRARLPLAAIALAVALVSLLLNGYLLWQISHPERWAGEMLQRISGGAADASGTLRYTVRIPAGTPINLDIPVRESFRIRVDTVFPLNTRVRVPIRGPLGTANITIPIRANVPVRTMVPLHIRHTFRLRTRTPEPIEVPIQLDLRQLLRTPP